MSWWDIFVLAVRVHKARVHIQVGGPGEGGQGLLHQLVNLGILLPKRVHALAPGKHTQYESVSRGLVSLLLMRRTMAVMPPQTCSGVWP
uniref:Uncharacterized protein n=1 Tax=Anguilla anguilla TaxID=7936 RepID=A0A0E9RU92_ANGAN